MTHAIKPIETKYNGYKFRSRLEARWAVFFDALEIKYRYEPEGFDLDGTWYLPDFYLPEYYCWFEVKGPNQTIENLVKPYSFASTGRRIIVPTGDVWHDTTGYAFGFGIDCESTGIVPCPGCDGIGLLRTGNFMCLHCPTDIKTSEIRLTQAWMDAYHAARSAQFEHR